MSDLFKEYIWFRPGTVPHWSIPLVICLLGVLYHVVSALFLALLKEKNVASPGRGMGGRAKPYVMAKSSACQIPEGSPYKNETGPSFHLKKEGLLGPYLAGLIESDGSITVPDSLRHPKTKKVLYPVIKITFHLNDLPLAKKIIAVIGGGTIEYPKGNYVVARFYSISVVRLIVSLINGHMRTPKIEALHRLIRWLNKRPDQIENVPLLPLDDTPILSNSWLSGFIEGDGCFKVDLHPYSKGT